jgi:hypothetical protein
MTGSATARDGNMLRVIELHRGVGVLEAVQDAHPRRIRRSADLRRGEKAKAYDLGDSEYFSHWSVPFIE